MDIITEIIARGNLLKIGHQLQNSIDDMEKNNPNRLDYIGPMKEARENLMYSTAIFDELRSQLKYYKSHTSNLMLNIQLRDIEIEKLNARIKELMELL